MTVKLLTEHHLEILSLKGGCTGLSEATLLKMPHCWKSHAVAHLLSNFFFNSQSSKIFVYVFSQSCFQDSRSSSYFNQSQ